MDKPNINIKIFKEIFMFCRKINSFIKTDRKRFLKYFGIFKKIFLILKSISLAMLLFFDW